jgi:hypothetical protein
MWNPCEYDERRCSHQPNVLDTAFRAKLGPQLREPRTKLFPLDEGTQQG